MFLSFLFVNFLFFWFTFTYQAPCLTTIMLMNTMAWRKCKNCAKTKVIIADLNQKNKDVFLQLKVHFYLYVRLPTRSFPAIRNNLRALIASSFEYHKCGCGTLVSVSLKENLWFFSNVGSFCNHRSLESWEPVTSGLESGNWTM